MLTTTCPTCPSTIPHTPHYTFAAHHTQRTPIRTRTTWQQQAGRQQASLSHCRLTEASARSRTHCTLCCLSRCLLLISGMPHVFASAMSLMPLPLLSSLSGMELGSKNKATCGKDICTQHDACSSLSYWGDIAFLARPAAHRARARDLTRRSRRAAFTHCRTHRCALALASCHVILLVRATFYRHTLPRLTSHRISLLPLLLHMHTC